MYRQCAPTSRERKVMHSMLAGARDALQIDAAVLSIVTLAVLSHHVVGGSILLPGVGYVEAAFAAVAGRRAVLSAVAFVRPCVLPGPRAAASERCVLRCARRDAGARFEIASQLFNGNSDGGTFEIHALGSYVTSTATCV